MHAALDRLARLFPRRSPSPAAQMAQAIDLLKRRRLITPGEAHALIAGEHLADLYADIGAGEVGIDAGELAHVEHLIRVGDLPEALIALGRMHEALRDLPALYHRMSGRARP